ncbi:MAG: HrpE/YscL family type III secretion apparatus protein [Planctomycetaceae bacterium]|nr:HrpE/YscL family type III secretion apparatus protein [Planctomycetaceae bacterium]
MGHFLFLKPGNIDVGTGCVIKQDDYAHFVDARDIVATARREAERIVAEAEATYASEKARGFAEGIEEGKMEMSMRMLDSALESVNMISSMEDAIVDVVNRSVRTIIGDLDKHDVIERLVRKSLQYVRDQKRITIRLNPVDAEEIRGRLDSITRDMPGTVRVDVLPDGRLEPLMCTLETEMGVVDASLEKQLDIIEQALRKEVGSRG